MKPISFKYRQFLYALAGINGLIILGWWWLTSGSAAAGGAERLTALGRLMGLVAGYGVLIDMLLMSRLPIVERAFGLEGSVKLHRWTGYAVFIGIILHPILLVLGYQIDGKPGIIAQSLKFIFTYPDVLKATIATVMFVVVVGTSIAIVRARLRYELWYVVHLMTYGAILLALGHQLSNGQEFVGHTVFRLYWVALYAATFSVVLVYRFANPVASWWVHRLRIERVEAEAEGIYSFYIKGRNLDRLSVIAGQFFNVRILTPQLWSQSHPFSLSRNPDGRSLRFSFKVLGDYTSLLPELRPNTPVLLDGARGNFTWEQISRRKVLLVAGGIGITPLLALLEAKPQDLDVVFVYYCRNEKEVAFTKELKRIEQQGTVVHIVAGDQAGRLSKASLIQLCPDLRTREAFISGPDGMIAAFSEALRLLKVEAHLIHSERFSY